jgi:hypothetical protein
MEPFHPDLRMLLLIRANGSGWRLEYQAKTTSNFTTWIESYLTFVDEADLLKFKFAVSEDSNNRLNECVWKY